MPISPITYQNAPFGTAITANIQASPSAKPSSAPKNAVSSGQYDVLEISPSDNQSRLARFDQILESLKEQYPHLSFAFTEDLTTEGLPAHAAGMGGGHHILISQGFLNRLQQSDKDFFACQQMLGKACQQLSTNDTLASQGVYLGEDKAISWSVPSKENPWQSLAQQPKEQTLLDQLASLPKTSDTQKLKTYLSSSSRNTNTGGHYMRLANAKSKSSVQAAMSDAQRSIASLRLTASLGTDKERIEANRAIRSYQKLLLRGRQKIKRFEQEALVNTRKKRAEKQQQIRKARQAKEELSQKRLSRHVADSAIRYEGRMQNCAYRFAKRYDPYDDERYNSALSAPTSASSPSSSAEGTATMAPTDVTISSVSTF